MSIWNWTYKRRFYGTQDQETMSNKMIELFDAMMDNLRTNPDLALQYGEQSRKIAELIGDSWWEQLCHHWELQCKLNFKEDFSDTIEIATKSAIEVRKTAYQEFPQRICLHEDLITAFVRQDPLSHQDLIQNALDYMAQEATPQVECYQCLHSLKVEFAIACHRYQDAIPLAQQALIVSERSDHHLSYVYGMLAVIAFRLNDWDNLLIWANSEEEHARKTTVENCLITALMWQAVCAEHAGDSKRAKELQKQAGMRASRYGASLGIDYYTALTAYHEQGNRLGEALKIQQVLLDKLDGKSSFYDESQAYLEIIRLKKLLKQSMDQDIQKAREVIQQMKNPAPMLERLEKLIA